MTLEQKIAAKALELIGSVRSPDKVPSPEESEYRSHSEGLPGLLRSCGLSRTLAFLRARSKVQQQIASHLEMQFRNSGILDEKKDLQQHLASCSLREYRAYSSLTMLIALWQKRVAQACLRRKER
jgi:CRISPR type III-B/RAMP module-associated protein Cmr5